MILDTNGLLAMADGSPNLNTLIRAAPELAVPVIVIGEYRYGIEHSRHRRHYEEWLSGLIANCRVLLVDELTAASTHPYAATGSAQESRFPPMMPGSQPLHGSTACQ